MNKETVYNLLYKIYNEETAEGTWELAEGIVLSCGRVRIVNNAGRITKRISGDLRLLDCEGVETGGFIDTEIIPDPCDPDRMYLGTLVKNAYLNIGKNIRLQGGTIRFELCSTPHMPGKPLPYHIDEMDELLFQTTDPVPLGAMHIVGVGNDPVTLSMSINALTPGNVRAFISLYPASLFIPVFGKNTVVFLTGENKDNVIEMDIKNEWSNILSSSPHLNLVSPLDHEGKSLVEGAFLLIGRLECRGMSCARLSLSSYLNYATAFPQSKWPQKLPYQKITFSISETGEPSLMLKFNPLSIDSFLISSNNGKDELLEAALCDKGLLFNKGYLFSQESSGQPRRRLPPFIIDNACRVLVEAEGEMIEMRDWFSEKSRRREV
jgi:hypothetical protein